MFSHCTVGVPHGHCCALQADPCWLSVEDSVNQLQFVIHAKWQLGEKPEAMDEVEVVILRFSLAICNPGCLHLVLESVSPKAPYLLENRTPHPFQYRQAAVGQLLT